MGAYFSNYQVNSGESDPAAIREQLINAIQTYMSGLGYEAVPSSSTDTDIDRTIVISAKADHPWISLYDEEADGGDPESLDLLGIHLSSQLEQTLVGVSVADSDHLFLRLYEEGAVKDKLVSSRPRKRLAHWKPLIPAPHSLEDFSSALYTKTMEAEFALERVGGLLGFDREHCRVGYRYLPDIQTDDFTFLRFRLKNRMEEQKGDTKFDFNAWLSQWDGQTGEVKEIHTMITNLGKPSVGMAVVVWGPAVEQGIVQVDSVRVWDRGLDVTLPVGRSTTPDGQPLWVARFPDYPIADGFDPEDPANKHLSYEKVLKKKFACAFNTGVTVTAVQAGNAPLYLGFVPLANPDQGQKLYGIPVEIR